jgi:hypothetical protein
MKNMATSSRILVLNFASSELNDVTKLQIRRETKTEEVVELHLPCNFNLGKPLPPQIAEVIKMADQLARNAGFSDGLLGRTVIIPPGFADAAFIMGAWMAYANVGITSPIRTMRFNTGWTSMIFEPQMAYIKE